MLSEAAPLLESPINVFLWVAALRIIAAVLAISIIYPSLSLLWRRARGSIRTS
jgi:hypothetical protein